MKWDQSEILFQKMYPNSGDKIYIDLFVDQKKKKSVLSKRGVYRLKELVVQRLASPGAWLNPEGM